MADFENALVHAFNDFAEQKNVPAVAYRVKQAKYTGQWCDVLVDSPHNELYLAVENKSLKTSNREKLYFSQHFSEKEGMHQVEHFTQFLDKSGRRGFLALEVRRGRGTPKDGFLLPWPIVEKRFQDGDTGLTIDFVAAHPKSVALKRKAHKYRIPTGFV